MQIAWAAITTLLIMWMAATIMNLDDRVKKLEAERPDPEQGDKK